ncbi:hypothetical protein SLEP1_g47401 [Rubroshorea leprosula]|uniref:BRCT domain-containing protein n=1 Tax=Rubroshorea leprosula TaxID=152421 RepID=A0AAV5LS83_9ROSI|nr:hypothetical protein SLEP1_g47401 [Rubroshorea leprosula]
MASVGFRRPQFSEELAWLPVWLQQSSELVEEAPIADKEPIEGLASLRVNISQEGDLDRLSREEGGYNSCHLFLSGEDSSRISSASSPGDVLHLRLYLSSDSESQNRQSQLSCAFRGQCDSDKVLPVPEVEFSAATGEKEDQTKTKNDAVRADVLPPTSIPDAMEKFGPENLTDNGDCRELSEEKLNVKNFEDSDSSDAVELSVAASEALVIHELVNSRSEALGTEAVLEAALQVKQARLESLEGVSSCPTEETDEIDFLSDLDDLTMMDAFEDVGLSFSSFSNQHACGSDICLVKDSPMSKNCDGCDNRQKHVSLLPQENEHSNDLASCLKTPTLASHHLQSEKEISHVSDTVQRVGTPIMETSVQPQVNMDSCDARTLQNAKEDKVTHLTADGFRSRWFDGWTGKPRWKSIPKCFAVETSFLSESADVAPDENSFVHKHESRPQIAADESVQFEGLHDQAEGGFSVSQDVKSTNVSLVDPLCSVVPCSISSEYAGSPLVQDPNCREANAQNCFSLTDDLGVGNFLRTSELNVESVYEKGQTLSPITGERSAATVRRQLNSLKTYSTLPLKYDSLRENGRPSHDQSTPLNLEHNLCSAIFSDKRDFERPLPVRSTIEYIHRDAEEVQNARVLENSVLLVTNDKKSSNERAKYGVEFQVKPLKGTRSPLILNQRIHQRLRTSRLLVHGSLIKKNPVRASRKNPSNKLHYSRILEETQSEGKNRDGSQVSSRKRVHFSEAEGVLQQTNDHKKLKSLHKRCSATRVSKRFESDSSIQDMKRCFPVRAKDVKKLIFQDVEFLLTGFSSIKEKEIEGLIRNYGGVVLADIPSPSNSRGKRNSMSKFQQLPVVLCSKKLQTTKFLFGCAINAPILKIKWLTDSIAAGKYIVLSSRPLPMFLRIGKPVRVNNHACIFDSVGIMLHGKHSFCTKFAAIIQHGGGRVFKTLQWLVQSLDSEKISLGVIVAEDESRASRHLRHCASERKIPVMPTSWIVKSLHSGKLLPLTVNNHAPSRSIMAPEFPLSMDWSQEI